eukprot:1186959-Prorocentrum_minimum.AAC.2
MLAAGGLEGWAGEGGSTCARSLNADARWTFSFTDLRAHDRRHTTQGGRATRSDRNFRARPDESPGAVAPSRSAPFFEPFFFPQPPSASLEWRAGDAEKIGQAFGRFSDLVIWIVPISGFKTRALRGADGGRGESHGTDVRVELGGTNTVRVSPRCPNTYSRHHRSRHRSDAADAAV